MADIDNFSEINDNFDTIKTLLNSIRAQGILNTSDVDKLLSGINTKLEKINTEEDIDLIKAFLSDLKQNLDERHSVLISKFGAIESLFSNLLKNSADTLKASEIKELFDIVATNLSVFSREVVSQKETLNDITLRIDAMRSDDTRKNEIIKNISVLRGDIERVTNGFDSIVLSLNDNFKTVVKTISGIDHTDDINKFGDQISDIVNSSNTILAALQVLDKKNTQIEELVSNLATKDDITGASRSVAELAAQSKLMSDSIETMTEKSYKMDILSEKIDASVNVISGLRAVISESGEQSAKSVLEKLEKLEQTLREVTSNDEFNEFKSALETMFKGIADGSVSLQSNISSTAEEIKKISANLQTLDINVGFTQLAQNLSRQTQTIQEQVITEAGKISQLVEVNVTRTLNDISSNAEALTSRLKDTQTALAGLCEKSFVDVLEGISNLKSVVSQIDENSVSANNAIFSNISDRLAVFENNLKTSLANQEESVSTSSEQVTEQIAGISKLTSGIDYKLDSSLLEIGNSKRSFEELKASVDSILALDFVNTVKDIRVDLYAVKQDITENLESTGTELSDKITNDLFGKYELLVSKLDSVEDEIKTVQKNSLDDMKFILDKISSSLMDILSYVSMSGEANTEQLDSKLQSIADKIQDVNLNYVENVRDVVDVIKTQVENYLTKIEKNAYLKIDSINNTISSNTLSLKEDMQNTYQKLVDVQGNFDEIKETLNINNITLTTNIDNIMDAAGSIKSEFEIKMSALKNTLLDKVSEYKQEFSCENADKISELKFNSETLHSKAVQNSIDLKNELRDEISGIIDSLKHNVSELSELTAASTLKMEGANKEVVDYIRNDFCIQVNSAVDTLKQEVSGSVTELGGNVSDVVAGFNNLKDSVEKLSNDTTSSLSTTLAKILDNFVLLKSVVNGSGEQISANFKQAVEEIKGDFQLLINRFNSVDREIDEDLSRQIKIIESNFSSINNLITDLQKETEERLADRIQLGLDNVAEQMRLSMAEKLEDYKASIETVFDKIKSQEDVQADFLKDRAVELNNILQNTLYAQNKEASSQIGEIAENLKNILSENIEVTAQDYNSLKEKLNDLVAALQENNNALIEEIKTQLDSYTKFVNSGIDAQAQEANSKYEEIDSGIQKIASTIRAFNSEFDSKVEALKSEINNYKEHNEAIVQEQEALLSAKLLDIKDVMVSDLIPQIRDYNSQISDSINANGLKLDTSLENLKSQISDVVDNSVNALSSQISDSVSANGLKLDTSLENLKSQISDVVDNSVNALSSQISDSISANGLKLDTSLENLKSQISDVVDNSINVFSSQISDSINANGLKLDISLENLKIQISNVVDNSINALSSQISEKIGNIEDKSSALQESVVRTKEQIVEGLSNINNSLAKSIEENSKGITNNIINSNSNIISHIKNAVETDILPSVDEISSKIQSLFEENALNVSTQLDNTNSKILEELKAEAAELKSSFLVLNERLDKDELSQMNVYQAQFRELSSSFTKFIEDTVNSRLEAMISTTMEVSTNQLGSMEAYADKILEYAAAANQNTTNCKNVIIDLVRNQFEAVGSEIEKETDVIVGDLLEQFSLLKDEQKDNLNSMVSQLEGSVAGYIVDSVNDLKSYLDIKTNSTVIDEKLDNLRSEMERITDDVLENINKMLEVSVFDGAISELRSTNEILITSMADKLNNQITDFISQNVAKKFDEKLNIFDKKFIDTLVDKLEEVKMTSAQYNTSFDKISFSIQDSITKFVSAKNDIDASLASAVDRINNSIDDLADQFEDLKAELANHLFDGNQKDFVINQISEIESLVKEQIGYIEDINELCASNLPELTEMNTVVKYGIQESLKELVDKLDSNDLDVEQSLSKLKTDIITQILNVFNQISFVAEQEEILDFIQEKHSELITVLSHIVTTSDSIEDVKDNLAVVDNKMNSLQEDIDLINEKITSIMSSDGDIEYVYSLQDLETDIANLRIVMNEMKDKIPHFEAAEFKKEFDSLSEDIISISSRTNKLLLASDESYKTLQDNLQDFKLVINDLDERTKNFAHESGMDIIDKKLGSLNKMMQNGEKTNQVFNQVFEYLAEWVDNAGTQISKISEKVESLNDMDQIRVMLEDLRVQASDNSAGEELVDALSNVFEKQAKRISSLEAKLDRVIVENNISKRDNKLDLTPMEETLNRFLASMDMKMSSQQDKINSLEAKLEEIMSLADNKETAQLSKKVGGMDRQIAKLNKSIEKIASHVVEK